MNRQLEGNIRAIDTPHLLSYLCVCNVRSEISTHEFIRGAFGLEPGWKPF